MAEHFQASGLVDYFNSDAGSFSSYWMEIPPAAVAAEDFRKINRELKSVSRLPVVGFGRVNSPQLAEEALQAGECDMIGMARQLIADPWTPEKTREGMVMSSNLLTDAAELPCAAARYGRRRRSAQAQDERRIIRRISEGLVTLSATAATA